MLTKSDIKQIDELIDKKLDKRFGSYNERKLDRKFKEINVTLKKIDENIEQVLRLIKHDYSLIQNHENRLQKIEKHLRIN